MGILSGTWCMLGAPVSITGPGLRSETWLLLGRIAGHFTGRGVATLCLICAGSVSKAYEHAGHEQGDAHEG